VKTSLFLQTNNFDILLIFKNMTDVNMRSDAFQLSNVEEAQEAELYHSCGANEV
jgi:hypothetical protein